MKDIFSYIYSSDVEIIIEKRFRGISTTNAYYHEFYIDGEETYVLNEFNIEEKKYFYSKNNFQVNNVADVADYKKGGYVLQKNEMSPIENLTPEGIEKLAYNYFKQFQFIEISFSLN
ncbi:hypothetical protein J3U42_03805 [Gilliamella sp. B2923]|uniref:hypothetical protein n=1 Tax=Gilliamella sp. B2923 TaxID=2818005 RepID=UPI002269EE20|nr:hypothetical protein [Gilliamella sp. B2923]MCX8617517.1 hypothetical protein [Gilliamella sp. B2923]